jgi:hypothetical protein
VGRQESKVLCPWPICLVQNIPDVFSTQSAVFCLVFSLFPVERKKTKGKNGFPASELLAVLVPAHNRTSPAVTCNKKLS